MVHAVGPRQRFTSIAAEQPGTRARPRNSRRASDSWRDRFDGEAIDSGLSVPGLTEYERHRVDEAKEASAEALGKAAAEVRTHHDRDLAAGISAKFGVPMR